VWSGAALHRELRRCGRAAIGHRAARPRGGRSQCLCRRVRAIRNADALPRSGARGRRAGAWPGRVDRPQARRSACSGPGGLRAGRQSRRRPVRYGHQFQPVRHGRRRLRGRSGRRRRQRSAARRPDGDRVAVRGPDGAFYVGELTGFPYYKGYARVLRVVAGQAPTVYAEGFTNIADIAFDDSGRLLVLEMSQEGLFAGRVPPPANLTMATPSPDGWCGSSRTAPTRRSSPQG